jgi:hypothetical protein
MEIKERGLLPYYHTRTRQAGAYIGIDYSFTGPAHRNDFYLSKSKALEYLAWLDAGNYGRHHQEFREARKIEWDRTML